MIQECNRAKHHRDENCPQECIGGEWREACCVQCCEKVIKGKCPKDCPYLHCSKTCNGKYSITSLIAKMLKKQA